MTTETAVNRHLAPIPVDAASRERLRLYTIGALKELSESIHGHSHADYCDCHSPEVRCARCGSWATSRLCQRCREAK